jgi:hypothetical protein
MLYTNIPQYESLDREAKGIYHEDKEKFESMARKGGQVLIYAKAGTSNETWVPLIEKAYAKLYGCYAHTEGGQTREAIEDLTGCAFLFSSPTAPSDCDLDIAVLLRISMPETSLTPTASGRRNCPASTRIVSSPALSTTSMRPKMRPGKHPQFKVSLGVTPMLSSALPRSTASALLFCETPGVSRNGMVLGPTDPRSGRRSG